MPRTRYTDPAFMLGDRVYDVPLDELENLDAHGIEYETLNEGDWSARVKIAENEPVDVIPTVYGLVSFSIGYRND